MARVQVQLKKPILIKLGLSSLIFEVSPDQNGCSVEIACASVAAGVLEKTLGYLDPFTLGEIDSLNIE